jgi:hypothetical protein
MKRIGEGMGVYMGFGVGYRGDIAVENTQL